MFPFYLNGFSEAADEKNYDQYYVMITEDRKSSFWQSVYQGAYERGLEEKQIPVVTLYGDNTHSSRCSFVGVGSYNLGREYGRQVLKLAKEKEERKTPVRAAVDYNKVGDVSILGYYDSDTIIKAIDRNVINATVSVNTEQMGSFCIDALTEYYQYGNTSQYFTADVTLIDKDNVWMYLEGGDEGEE